MAKDLFQFKKFGIHQGQSAMKVCTDSCLFGAHVYAPESCRILDIGTGTGLLALMLAQRHQAPIDAVEINPATAEEARRNVRDSPWPAQIKVYNQSIQDFSQANHPPYDLIVTNPPFYKNQLIASDQKKNLAMHSLKLSLPELAAAVDKLMAAKGNFYVMLPPFESDALEQILSEYCLFPVQKLAVKENANQKTIRYIIQFSRGKAEIQKREFMIKEPSGSYSTEFQQLLKDYYIIF